MNSFNKYFPYFWVFLNTSVLITIIFIYTKVTPLIEIYPEQVSVINSISKSSQIDNQSSKYLISFASYYNLIWLNISNILPDSIIYILINWLGSIWFMINIRQKNVSNQKPFTMSILLKWKYNLL